MKGGRAIADVGRGTTEARKAVRGPAIVGDVWASICVKKVFVEVILRCHDDSKKKSSGNERKNFCLSIGIKLFSLFIHPSPLHRENCQIPYKDA